MIEPSRVFLKLGLPMSTRTTGSNLPLETVAIAIMVLLSACSAEEPEPVAVQPPPVDPRFASADALLEYYNQIAMREPTADPAGIFTLLYAETPIQERLVQVYKNSLPLMELDAICWEKFGAGLRPDSKESPFAPARNSAIMAESGQDRAKARVKENNGQNMDLHLVRYNGRWWISGYTLEYDREFYRADVDLDQLERGVRYLSASAPKVVAEIESGTGLDFAAAGEQAPQIVYLRLLAYVFRDFPEAQNMRDFFGIPEN